MNGPDAVAHTDRVQHLRATDDAPKDRVNAVEVRLRGVRDEILAPAGVGAGERHADGANVVPHGIDLVAEVEPRPGATPAVSARVAVLDHEIRDDAMPARAIEEAPVDEAQKCRDRERRVGGGQLDVEPSAETADSRASLNGSLSARRYAVTSSSTSSRWGWRASKSAATLRTAGSACVTSARARASNVESDAGTTRCSACSACATTRPSGSERSASRRSRARVAPNASAATLRQRQSASPLTAAAAAIPAALSACASARIAWRLSVKTLLVRRGPSAAIATLPRDTPSVVSACTATPMSRSPTSGTTARATLESRNDASARRALMRMCASRSSSRRRHAA